jgi:hypothetical protein
MFTHCLCVFCACLRNICARFEQGLRKVEPFTRIYAMFALCLRMVYAFFAQCLRNSFNVYAIMNVCTVYAQCSRNVCATFAQRLRNVCAEGVLPNGQRKQFANTFAKCLRSVCAEGSLLMKSKNIILAYMRIHSWNNCRFRCSDCCAHFLHDRNNISPFPSPAAPSSQHPKSRLVDRPGRAPPSRDDDRSPTPSFPPTTDPCRFQQGKRFPGRCVKAAAKRTSTGNPVP